MSGEQILRFILDHPGAIFGALIALGVLRAIIRGRGRLADLAEDQARRRAVAASMGLRTPSREWRDDLVTTVLASIADAPEKLGPFPRLLTQPRIQVQFEGDHAGMQATIALHKRWIDEDGDGTPSTLACFASPEIGVSAFELKPVPKPTTGELDGPLGSVERFLTRIGWLKPEVRIRFDRTFDQLYVLKSDFAVTIRDDFHARVLEFFETHPGWHVEGLKGRLLVWHEEIVVPADAMPTFLREAAALAQVFRRPLNQDL
jgi:hypothetical protein